ncbi:MAG: long-chain fatty acid--CoA ligase [Armatimonadetes bacterium]|nr:long-chain fatty acid--CoA ligase [Armatimonadota bacterium]
MTEPQSLGAMLRQSCREYADRPAMYMPINQGMESLSYRGLYERAYTFAKVLHKYGLKRGDRVVILSENCPEWAMTDWACQTLGLVVVPIYPTLPADQAQYIAKDAGAKFAVTGDDSQTKKLQGMAGMKVLHLKGVDSLEAQALRGEGDLTREQWEQEIDAAKIDDVATFIYTSGTTGEPKGAMLTHGSLMWVGRVVPKVISLGKNDVFFSFLPMSHVFERVNGQMMPIALGATIGYARSLKSLSADMLMVRPTVVLCVPRFLESVLDRVMDEMRKQPKLNQRIFEQALIQGGKRFRGEFAPLFSITDQLVGKKIRAKMGGRMRFFISGGAALPRHVAEFYGAFKLTVLQGFGLTETASGVMVNLPQDNKYWTVGKLLPGMELKIAEDGEILLRGPAIMKGYYHMEEATKAAIDPEGWFHTGDIGQMEGEHLRITDRKKDLLVLGNGKNVAPQPIENKIKSSRYVSEAVVLGDGMEYCVALIVPNEEHIRSELKLPKDTHLSESQEAKKLVMNDIQSINRTLAPYEAVKRIALLDRPFSIDEGELTPSLKVKRKVVKDRYKAVIDSLRL